MKSYIYDCNECGTTLQASVEHMSRSCRCSTCNHSQIPAPTRQQVTNQNIVKSMGSGCLVVFVLAIPIGLLFSGIWPVLLGGFMALAMFILPMWIFTNLVTDWLYMHDETYRQYRKFGSPFWDNFLVDTKFYVLPNLEPDYDRFVPPSYWRYQCLGCNARVEGVRNPCWNCKRNL